MEAYELPIIPVHPDDDENPDLDQYIIHKHGLDGFFYFIQRTIDEWCYYVQGHQLKYEYSLRCMNDNYYGYGFLLDNFESIWGIIDGLTFETFEWYSIIIDIDSILKCTQFRVIDYDDLNDLKEHLYQCNDFEDEYMRMWDDATMDIIAKLRAHSNLGAAEANLVEYLEDKLLASGGDSNMMPIWIKLMKL